MERATYIVLPLTVLVGCGLFGDSEPTLELDKIREDPALCGQYVGEVRDRVLGFRGALAAGCMGKSQPEPLRGFCELQPTLGTLSDALGKVPPDACDRYRDTLDAADLTVRAYGAWKRALPEIAK